MDEICNIPVDVPTAPQLVLDLLAATGSALSVRTLCRAGRLIGISESAIRVALNRLVEQGKISNHARGSYTMHSDGSALTRILDDWQHETVRPIKWDRSWIAVQDAAVPRSDKTGWRRHNLALGLSGFRQLQTGLHVRPNNLAGNVESMRQQLEELGLSAQSMVFRLDRLDAQCQARALGLWEVATLTSEYQQIQQALHASAKALKKADLNNAVRESLLLGRAVIRRLVRDPLLPTEIVPARYRQGLTEDMKVYYNNARHYWNQWLDN